jgi:hypothetical protein
MVIKQPKAIARGEVLDTDELIKKKGTIGMLTDIRGD